MRVSYWRLISKAVRSNNLEELQCLLTGYQDETLEFQKENSFKLPANKNRSINDKKNLHSKEMCYVSMSCVINEYCNAKHGTLLYMAISQYSPEAVRLLLQHGANPNFFNCYDFATPLLLTLIKFKSVGHKIKSKPNPEVYVSKLKEIIKLLIDFDADLYNLTPDGLSYLHIAVTGTTNVFTELYNISASCTSFNVNYQIPEKNCEACYLVGTEKIKYSVGDTALHVFAKSGNANNETGKALLKSGINPNTRNMNGCTALHYSANKSIERRSLYELLPVLLEAGCDPNVQVTSYDDNFQYPIGFTPLHIVFEPMFFFHQLNLRDIKLLLKNGGNLDILDSNNDSPMIHYYKNIMDPINLKPFMMKTGKSSQLANYCMDIFQVLMSGGAMTRRALKDVSSLDKMLRQKFECLILTFYTHTWLFETLVDIRYPFLFLNETSEYYQLYSNPQSLKRLSAMVLYSTLKPNVWCGIQKLNVPTSIRDYVILGKMDILFSNTCHAIYNDEHWQSLIHLMKRAFLQMMT